MKILVTIYLFLFSIIASAQVKVATLHPVLTDIAKNVGGKNVVVVDLIGNKSVHGFNPTPSVLKKATGAKLYLAAGKGLEPYLGKLEQSLSGKAVVYEVGKKISSIQIDNEHAHT